MGSNIFKEGDTVVNLKNDKEYYIDEVEKSYNVDTDSSEDTGYVSCRPEYLDDNLPKYNRFNTNDLKIK